MALARISHIVFALAVCALLCLQIVAAQGTMETDSNGLPLPPDAAGAAVQPWVAVGAAFLACAAALL
ncbi:hypothetical protein DQ04_00791020 [Trypanosoma grayi]|uniref:hypothetical protein n=1 Tax=Trypanosoma grayi TaxID=71804 RepID=UPI0004F48AAD|nr:hypothetical protein DQ04_00791020 [Trypanosoma grayi]KEG13772.1 hypothetical protein DQ04_00791020 [Trypanosoma grayi]